MIRKRSKARIAASAVALAAAAGSALMFTAAADAVNPTVYNVTNLSGLVTDLGLANSNTTSPTIINLAGSATVYAPTATLAITNTTQPITIQGPTPSPTTAQQLGATVQGTAVTSPEAEDSVFSVAPGATLNLNYLLVDSAGSSVLPAVDDNGTLNTQGLATQGNRGPVTVEQSGTANLQDSTFVGNLSVGVQVLGTATLTNDTVWNNGSGGIDDGSATALHLVNSIVGDNTGGDCFLPATSSDHSIDTDGTCGVGAPYSASTVASVHLPTNPSTTYGGPTATEPPLAGSIAIGHADSAVAPTTDERGYTRPATADDIGAVQTGPGPTLVQAGTTEQFVATVASPETYTTTWTPGAFPIVATSEACLPAEGSTFPFGPPGTPVDCTASDTYGTTVGSTASAVAGYTFTVLLAAASPPVVTITPTTGTVTGTLPALTTTVNDSTSASGVDVSWTDSALDAIDGSIPVTCSDTAGPVTSGSLFPIGSTLVTCKATDSHSLMGSATLDVVVVDTSTPVVTVPGNITQNVAAGTSVAVTFSPAPSATDLVDGTIAPTCTIPATGGGTTTVTSGSMFAAPATAGNSTTTTVTCTATDSNHLTGSNTFTVTINAVAALAPTQQGNIIGTVQQVLALTPPPTCNLGLFTPGFAFTYTCTTTTDATSTYALAYLTIQDITAGDTTGEHLANGTASLLSPFTVAAASGNAAATSSPATVVKTAPTQLLAYNNEVTGDPITLTVKQPIGGTEPLTNGTYAATVQLTLTETP